MHLNTEATADPHHQSAGALPYCRRKLTRPPWSVTEDAVEVPMCLLAQERTARALTPRYLKSLPAFFCCLLLFLAIAEL
jgi:hypothetical protein